MNPNISNKKKIIKKILLKYAVSTVVVLTFIIGIPFIFYNDESFIISAETAKTVEWYESEIERLARLRDAAEKRGNSLSREIDIIESNIQLKTVQIQQAEFQIEQKTKELDILREDIGLLEVRLERLDETIEYHNDLLGKRIKRQYIENQQTSFEILMSSDGVGDFLAKMKYLQEVELQDRELIKAMGTTKDRYEDQKNILREKKEQVEAIKKEIENQKAQAESLRSSLAAQKQQKDELLRITKNDEKRYAEMLEKAKEEYESLQAILSGSGIESSGEKIEEGQLIASVIPSASCNSSGSHLHFTVEKGNDVINPFSVLKEISNYRNCSGFGSCSSGDDFNPKGDWNWPLKGTITMTQGYGYSWATKNTWVRNIYTFHNGIDIKSTSAGVYASYDGTYYRGYYKGSRGCKLQYVKVVDEDEKYTTYYLHVNY